MSNIPPINPYGKRPRDIDPCQEFGPKRLHVEESPLAAKKLKICFVERTRAGGYFIGGHRPLQAKQLFAQSLELLRHNDGTLNELKLQAISDDEFQRLMQALKANRTLKTLRFVSGRMNLDKAKALREMLEANETLTSLSLASSSLIFPETIGELVQALLVNSTLESLDVSGNDMMLDGVQMILTALSTTQTLTSLNLFETNLDENAGELLGKVLENNHSLLELDLTSNELNCDGIVPLGQGLGVNDTLTSLDLSLNGIRDNGIIALAEALKTNRTLKHLILDCNFVFSEGAQALASALKVNTTLLHLSIGFFSRNLNEFDNIEIIGDEGAKELVEALKENHTLRKLELDSYDISDEHITALRDVAKEKNADFKNTLRQARTERLTLACSLKKLSNSKIVNEYYKDLITLITRVTFRDHLWKYPSLREELNKKNPHISDSAYQFTLEM